MNIIDEIEQAWVSACSCYQRKVNTIFIPQERELEFMNSTELWIITEFKKGHIIKCFGCEVLFVTNLDKIKAGCVNTF